MTDTELLDFASRLEAVLENKLGRAKSFRRLIWGRAKKKLPMNVDLNRFYAIRNSVIHERDDSGLDDEFTLLCERISNCLVAKGWCEKGALEL